MLDCSPTEALLDAAEWARRSKADDLADVRGKLLLTIRIERLRASDVFAEAQEPVSSRLQTPQIERDEATTNSYLDSDAYGETRYDDSSFTRRRPHMAVVDELRIRLQGVDLVNATRLSETSSFSCTGDARSPIGAVACSRSTIPYRRYSTNSAQWWGRDCMSSSRSDCG